MSVSYPHLDVYKRQSVDYAGVLQGLELLGLEEKDNLKLEEIQGKEKDDVTTYCAEKIFTLYDDKIKDCLLYTSRCV